MNAAYEEIKRLVEKSMEMSAWAVASTYEDPNDVTGLDAIEGNIDGAFEYLQQAKEKVKAIRTLKGWEY